MKEIHYWFCTMMLSNEDKQIALFVAIFLVAKELVFFIKSLLLKCFPSDLSVLYWIHSNFQIHTVKGIVHPKLNIFVSDSPSCCSIKPV